MNNEAQYSSFYDSKEWESADSGAHPLEFVWLLFTIVILQGPRSIWQWVHFLSHDCQKTILTLIQRSPRVCGLLSQTLGSSEMVWDETWNVRLPRWLSCFFNHMILHIPLGFDTTVGKLFQFCSLSWHGGCCWILPQWIGPVITVILTLTVYFLCGHNSFLFQLLVMSTFSFKTKTSTFHSQS